MELSYEDDGKFDILALTATGGKGQDMSDEVDDFETLNRIYAMLHDLTSYEKEALLLHMGYTHHIIHKSYPLSGKGHEAEREDILQRIAEDTSIPLTEEMLKDPQSESTLARIRALHNLPEAEIIRGLEEILPPEELDRRMIKMNLLLHDLVKKVIKGEDFMGPNFRYGRDQLFDALMKAWDREHAGVQTEIPSSIVPETPDTATEEKLKSRAKEMIASLTPEERTEFLEKAKLRFAQDTSFNTPEAEEALLTIAANWAAHNEFSARKTALPGKMVDALMAGLNSLDTGKRPPGQSK